MVVWFAAIAVPALYWIAADPGVLWAFDPFHGIYFLIHHGIIGLFTLRAVFLAVTGAEALYADLGHFGRGPIQVAWSHVRDPMESHVWALVMSFHLGAGAVRQYPDTTSSRSCTP